MRELPKEWHVNIVTDSKSKYLDKFKKWFQERCRFNLIWDTDIYGFDGDFLCFDYGKLISLQEWHDATFGEDFVQGEEVLAKWGDSETWITAIFIAEINDKFVADWDENLYYFDKCKKKPSEIDIKIEELRKLAEDKGLRFTITFE
jgi:hypothetical protein